MDPAPRDFAELPLDPELGTPVPFACGTGEPGAPASARTLDHRRVTQCALSRTCGVCGSGLGRPIAFLGTPAEEGRNAFHFPPSHVECAERLLAVYAEVRGSVLGQTEPFESWVLVTTGGFEYARPRRTDLDRRATFEPHPPPLVEPAETPHRLGPWPPSRPTPSTATAGTSPPSGTPPRSTPGSPS